MFLLDPPRLVNTHVFEMPTLSLLLWMCFLFSDDHYDIIRVIVTVWIVVTMTSKPNFVCEIGSVSLNIQIQN